MSLRLALRLCFSVLLLVAIGWFFSLQVREHWSQLSTFHLNLHWPYLGAALALVIAHYLGATMAWRMALLGGTDVSLSFLESVGVSNISQLTKYVPGKVWSYAIQLHFLASRKISKTRVISTNLLMLLSLIASAGVIGCGYLVFSRSALPPSLTRGLFAALVGSYLVLVFGGAKATNVLIGIVNRMLGRNIAKVDISLRLAVLVHSMNLAANLLYGAAGFLTALGVGVPWSAGLVGPIFAATLLSDVTGFLAIVVPGGLGVREGVMFAMLKPFLDIQLCFALPVVFRLLTAAVDLVLGGTSLYLLYIFARRRGVSNPFQRGQNA